MSWLFYDTWTENSVATAQIFKSIWVSKKRQLTLHALHGSSYHLPSSSKLKSRRKISACNVGHRRKCVQLLCPGDPRHQGQVQDIGRDLLPGGSNENNVKLHTLMAWKRFWIDFYDCNHPFGELWRHICQTCFFFYPATSLAYAYAVVWSHFEGNLTKWHVIPIQNTTASMFLKGQLCRINFGLSQGSQKLFCAIHVPEAD